MDEIWVTRRIALILLVISAVVCLQPTFAAGSDTAGHAAIAAELALSNEYAQELSAAGLGTRRLSDLHAEAESSLGRNDLDGAADAIKSMRALSALALATANESVQVTLLIQACGRVSINVTRAESLLAQARDDMVLEDFEGAALLVDEAWSDVANSVHGRFDPGLKGIDALLKEAEHAGLSTDALLVMKLQMSRSLRELDVASLAAYEAQIDEANNSVGAILSIRAMGDAMATENMSTAGISDIEMDAVAAFRQGNFALAMTRGADALELKSRGIRARESMDTLSGRIEHERQLGVDATSAMGQLGVARQEYEQGNFEGSSAASTEGGQALDEAVSQSLLFGTIRKRDIVADGLLLLSDYWWQIVGSLVVIGVVSKILTEILVTKYINGRLVALIHSEKQSSENLRRLQDNYFNKHALSAEEYGVALDAFEERRLRTREEIRVLESRLSGRLHG